MDELWALVGPWFNWTPMIRIGRKPIEKNRNPAGYFFGRSLKPASLHYTQRISSRLYTPMARRMRFSSGCSH